MAEQKKINVCVGCDGELKLYVKYCPFCGVSQVKMESIPPIVPVTTKEKIQDLIIEDEVVLPEQNPALISHITQKKGKELFGIIVLGSSLEVLKQYDRYAFKKDNGIFVRLKHLAKIPNEYLSTDQFRLKYQENIKDINIDEEATEEAGTAQTRPIQALPVIKPQVAETPPAVPTPLDTPQPKSSSFKYIAIAFIVILIVIFLVFNDKEETTVDMPSDAGEAINNCEVANSEISSLLSEKMPVRALSIIKLHQQECKTNGEFVQLLVSAEAQTTLAKEKIALAKEYVQASNLELAHETAVAALDLDRELVGGNELLQKIQMLIEQQNNAVIEEPLPEEQEAAQPQVIEQSESTQGNQAAVLAAEQARQQAEIAARKQAEQVDKERQQGQQAAELARKQAAEFTRKQNEERFDNQLNRAERALKSNNYGLAKSLAREVLSSSSNNAQAKRILRQAEQGETRAFDEMVIE
ncbi:hypothetical protein [Acinetobacter sp. ANC 5378]|uniref:hypothetical protein n=1 Tax=Acinetobacter sp. ANC 5378 TaxID=2731249 RepID=UPI00148FBB67|nr:hypothetical protein [Acinetobacter sp. ANC 5378]NNG81409.1 hypothetical protein [Acinetobacter sp. ANC 5378]